MHTYTTVLATYNKALIDALLAALSTRPAAALLTTPTLGLFIGATVPSENSLYADFAPPTFHGYAGSVATLAGPVNAGLGVQGMVWSATFIATSGGAIADTVTGYWLSDGAAAWYVAERLPTPVGFAAVGDALTINLVIPLGTSEAIP